MMPYRTVDNVIGGVVITFVDITRITAAETRIGELTLDLRNRVQSLETLLNLLPVGDPDRRGRSRRPGTPEPLRGAAPRRKRPQRRRHGPAARSRQRCVSFEGERELGPSEQPLYRAAHSGQCRAGLRGRRPCGPTAGGSSVMMSATPMFDDQGKVRGGIAAILDISERRVAEAHQQVLLYELQHRVKNIITTIGALASRMMKDSRSLEEFSPAFLGRLRAMAATHELLSHGNWTGASLRALIEAALQSHLGNDGTTRDSARSRPDLDAGRRLDAGPGVLRTRHQRHQVRQPVGRRTGRRRPGGSTGDARAGQRRDRLDRERRPARERSHRAGLRHQLRHAQHRIRAERHSGACNRTRAAYVG